MLRSLIRYGQSVLRPQKCVQLSQTAGNKYKPWPQEKVRRTGRKAPYWKGQGGKRSRIAYDKRYPQLSGKDINTTAEGLSRGGSSQLAEMIADERELFPWLQGIRVTIWLSECLFKWNFCALGPGFCIGWVFLCVMLTTGTQLFYLLSRRFNVAGGTGVKPQSPNENPSFLLVI